MSIINTFTCTGAYAVLIMSGLKRVENRSCLPAPARGRCAMSVSKKFCRFVKTRRPDAMQKQQKAKAGMKSPMPNSNLNIEIRKDKSHVR